MAKKGHGKRRRFNLRRVRITAEQALATLASDTALVTSTTGAGDIPYRAITMNLTWAIRDATQGEGPVTVGYAHSDYTVTEIKECLESQAAISQGDKVANERSKRLVRIVGVLNFDTNGFALNDGKPIKTRLNWLISVGDQVNIFIFNENNAALSTGAFVLTSGDMWVKDAT